MISTASLGRTILLLGLALTVAPAAARSETARVVCLGDSLTEGYGLAAHESYPAQLQQLLTAKGHKVEVINAGVSGATSASGPSRLRWQLRKKPDIVIIALGANDGLRGQSVQAMQANLDKTIALAKQAGITVLLAGMQMPRNYGEQYRRDFAAVFPALAAKHKVPLIAFLLDGVATDRALNLPDGIHPNAEGAKRVAQTVLAELEPLL